MGKTGWEDFYAELADKLGALDDQNSGGSNLYNKMLDVTINSSGEWRGVLSLDAWQSKTLEPLTVLASLNYKTVVDKGERPRVAAELAKAFAVTTSVPDNFNGAPVVPIESKDKIKGAGAHTRELFNLYEKAGAYGANPRDGAAKNAFIEAYRDAVNVKDMGTRYITILLSYIRPGFYMALHKPTDNFFKKNGIKLNGNKPPDNPDGQEYAAFLNDLNYELNNPQNQLLYGKTIPEVYDMAINDTDANNAGQNSAAANSAGKKTPKLREIKDSTQRNFILYGPPGTGKTYNTAIYAVSIIDGIPVNDVANKNYQDVMKRYRELIDKEKRAAFTTFHQSYGYEDFIEGIRPLMEEGGNSDLEYEIRPGVFKKFCSDAKTAKLADPSALTNLRIRNAGAVWKVSLKGAKDAKFHKDCFNEGKIRIGWNKYGADITEVTDYSDGGKNELNNFYNNMQIGDIVLSCSGSRTIDGIGVITGDAYWDDAGGSYKRTRDVNWLAKGIDVDIYSLNSQKNLTLSTVYKLGITPNDLVPLLSGLGIIKTDGKAPDKYVFIIDEINRGNISKIFGELITLIEPNKRIGAAEETKSKLPYSGYGFGVPQNVYILGTMNTADRSIALMDTALRRRFDFIGMYPDYGVLDGINIAGVPVAKMLETMNKRIAALYDREHMIGHSYFVGLKSGADITPLAEIFENRIIPLLQEYFFEDYEKIGLVLGDNQKGAGEPKFFIESSGSNLFGEQRDDTNPVYELNRDALRDVNAYNYLK